MLSNQPRRRFVRSHASRRRDGGEALAFECLAATSGDAQLGHRPETLSWFVAAFLDRDQLRLCRKQDTQDSICWLKTPALKKRRNYLFSEPRIHTLNPFWIPHLAYWDLQWVAVRTGWWCRWRALYRANVLALIVVYTSTFGAFCNKYKINTGCCRDLRWGDEQQRLMSCLMSINVRQQQIQIKHYTQYINVINGNILNTHIWNMFTYEVKKYINETYTIYWYIHYVYPM